MTIASACATSTPPPVTDFSDFPSPLSGPGRTQLSRHENERVAKGWRALSTGDTVTAAQEALRAGHSPEAQLLGIQARLLTESSAELVNELAELTERRDAYASAWITLSVAAARMGDEPTALTSARRGKELWPAGPFSNRAHDLETLWISDRLDHANLNIDRGEFDSAVSELSSVLNLEPESESALLSLARAQIGLGEAEQAEATLARLGNQPEALMLRAGIAYQNRQWNRSMDLLSRLPEQYPGRREALSRARLRWRLSILPIYVQEAVKSPSLTREQLAVLLVALAPSLETLPGGRTPLMPDVLKLPSQRSILTVTRLGIMAPDPVDNRFYPDRAVRIDQMHDAVEAFSHLIGLAPPIWCDSDISHQNGCTLLVEPLTGPSVTEVLLSYVVEDSEV